MLNTSGLHCVSRWMWIDENWHVCSVSLRKRTNPAEVWPCLLLTEAPQKPSSVSSCSMFSHPPPVFFLLCQPLSCFSFHPLVSLTLQRSSRRASSEEVMGFPLTYRQALTLLSFLWCLTGFHGVLCGKSAGFASVTWASNTFCFCVPKTFTLRTLTEIP